MLTQENVESVKPVVINGVDSPDLLSVDSTAPITTGVDEPSNDTKKEEVSATSKETNASDQPAKPQEELKKELTDEEKKALEAKEKAADEPPKQEELDAVQKRINKAVKKQRIAERERDFFKEEVQKLRDENTKLKQEKISASTPRKEDFDTEEEYLRAVTKHEIEKNDSTKASSTAAKPEEFLPDGEVNTAVELEEVFKTGVAVHEDFIDVVTDKSLQFTPEMIDLALDTSIPAEIMYYLGKNPAESAKVAKMSSLLAAKTMLQIEAKLIAEKEKSKAKPLEKEKPKETKETPAAKPEKKVSSAPDPINPPQEGGITQKNPENMTPKEYREWRESKNK